MQLDWHSPGIIADLEEGDVAAESEPVGSDEQRAERLEAEKRYCQRVAEIHDSYVNAPRMYKSNENAERVLESTDALADCRSRYTELIGSFLEAAETCGTNIYLYVGTFHV